MLDNHKYDNFYIDYHRIDHNLFRERILFYEKNALQLGFLNFQQKIDIDIDYCFCLFEIGKYHQFVDRVDPLIEAVIMENIYRLNGRDVYDDLLFKKAACLYNTDRFEESKLITSQLVKMNGHERSKLLHGKCMRKLQSDRLDWVRATAIVFMLSGLSLSLTILLIFEPFYTDIASYLVKVRNFLFISGILLIIGQEIWLWWRVSREIGHNLNQNRIIKLLNQAKESINNLVLVILQKTKR